MNSKHLAMENEDLKVIRDVLLESRVQVDRSKLRELQYQVSNLIGRNANAANTGRGFLSETENKVLGEVWSLLKDLA